MTNRRILVLTVLAGMLLLGATSAQAASHVQGQNVAAKPDAARGGVGTPGLPGAPIAEVIGPGDIDTTPSWNGKDSVQPFGYPDTATYGQVITVPACGVTLQSFTFYMNLPASCTFQGEVYAWDGAMATGAALWEGPPTQTSGSGTFEPITFVPGGVPLPAGGQYVLFASVSKLSGSGMGPWGMIYGNPYSGGDFVFINNGHDPSQWTSTEWDQFGYDLAFRATFGPLFDLSLLDDLGRAQFCVNTCSGQYRWTILSPPYTGLSSGGTLRVLNAGTLFWSFPGVMPYVYVVYNPNLHNAKGSLYGPMLSPNVKGETIPTVYSPLYDANTLNDPPGCQSVRPPV